MRLLLLLAIASSTLVGAARASPGDARNDLGAYERTAVARALRALDRSMHPDPAGKRIAHIFVVNLAVFPDEGPPVSWGNALHVTTEPHIIRRELLFDEGDRFDPAVVAETMRNLRESENTVLALALPLTSPEPDAVDVLVVTRDVFSLRLNSDFELQNGKLALLSVTPSENNLLGWRKRIGWAVFLDQGAIATGPEYVDPNIVGSRWVLEAAARAVWVRETGDLEGSQSRLRVAYPLFSLRTRWGVSTEIRHDHGVVREFDGDDLRTYDAPTTAADDAIPWRYERLTVGADSLVTRQFGDGVHHLLSIGHEFRYRRASAIDELDPAVREDFAEDVLPRDERDSALLLRYQLFEPRFAIYRNLDSYELAEDVRLGADLTAGLALGTRLLGSSRRFARPRLAAGYTHAGPRGGLYRVETVAQLRVEPAETINKNVDLEARAVSPRWFGARLHLRTGLSLRADDQSGELLTLGGLNGLRGYPVDALAGTRRWVVNAELRSGSVPLSFTRWGVVVFWDAGGAATSWATLPFRHDVGIGTRLLIPAFGPTVFRLDWAVPLGADEHSVLPGRILFGGGQAF